MPKGRLVITVKGRFFGMMIVCLCVCVEFAEGFLSLAVDVRADESSFEDTVDGEEEKLFLHYLPLLFSNFPSLLHLPPFYPRSFCCHSTLAISS